MISFSTCSGYQSENEDTIHALWYCSSLLVIWKDDAMLMKLFRYKFHGFDAWLGMLFSVRDRINTDLLALVFWLILRNRNTVRLKEQGVELHRIREKAKELFSNFLDAQAPQARSAMPRNSSVRWTPPIRPFAKINFDAALFKELDSAGFGIVV